MPQRYWIVGIAAVAALWMYIDRVCISILADPMQVDLGLSDQAKENALGAFFLTYALFQIPVGTLADRYGPRLILSLSIAAWSVVTACTGLVGSFVALYAVRLLLGVTEAGAYPAAAALVKRWALPTERGKFSAIVALGGRIGGAFAPTLTAALAIAFAGSQLIPAANPSGVNWRGVFVLYGTLGVTIAILFWSVVRDHPPHVPKVSRDDREDGTTKLANPLKTDRSTHTEQNAVFIVRLWRLATSRNMWLFGLLQFCNNISWAFLITLLPTYLKDAQVDLELRSTIQTGVLLAGCVGMLYGGFVTDYARNRLGLRWGRSAPIALTMTICALMCGVVSSSPGLWLAVGALAIMAFCQDLGIPAVWAFAQDVGGRNVGAALGWGNMLGNLGAAISPRLLGEVKRAGGWEAAFALCAGCYVIAVLSGLLMDASKPVEPDQED